MRFVGLSTLAIVALLSLAACPGDVAESETAAGPAPPVVFGDSPCGLCVAEACSDTIDSCAADPECAAHYSCLLACPIDASGDAELDCMAACPVPTTATGQNALTALTTCRQNGDGADCLDCGHPPAGHPLLDQSCEPPTAVNACDRCEEELCCETRCEAACQGYVGCMQTCAGAAACQDGCAASYAEGVAEFSRWLGCQVPLCRDHCTTLIPGPCLECGLVNCAHQFADCFASPACYLRFLCGTRCDSAACYQGCDAQYPEADALYGAFLLCVGESCIGGPCDGAEEF